MNGAQALIESVKNHPAVVPKGYVIVDIDNKDDERAQEYLERLLEKFEVKYSYNYTSKGIIHFRSFCSTYFTSSIFTK